MGIINAVSFYKRYHELYKADGTRDGSGPTFKEHLEATEGQAEVQALRARMEARLHVERKLARKRLERMEAGLQETAAPLAARGDQQPASRP